MTQMPIKQKIVTFWREQKPLLTAENFLHRWGALVVALFAFCYYAQYYRSGLNFGGEGGTVGVLAMRIMEGQRPIADTFLGYNVMWFYPVTWLFELAGPSYIALRIYFFAICTITGVLAFYIARKVTGSGWFATLIALGPVLVPGMIFRNYMGFLPTLNMLLLLQAYVFDQGRTRRQLLWMATAGAGLGLTFLVRVDLGEFFTIITLGLIVLYPLGRAGGLPRRLREALAGLLLTVVMVLATHAPVYYDAVRRGWDKEFTAQYTSWLGMIHYLAAQQLSKLSPPPAPTNSPGPAPTPPPQETVAPVTPAVVTSVKPDEPPPRIPAQDIDSNDYLKKRSLADAFRKGTFYECAFAIITYLPIPISILVVVPVGLIFLIALFRRDEALRRQALTILICFGCALTLFPQFFFFRPDTPHLSEFMVPFIVAMGCAVWLIWQWRGKLAIVFASLITLLCVADTSLYFYHTFPKESGGTIAANKKRNAELIAENGVRVFLRGKDRDETQQMCDLIKAHTRKGDWLICYPYGPTINFMTDRPSYEFNLYVDNSGDVAHFREDSLKKFEKYKPAVIVIDNRAVNQTEESRFKNWASETYAWIKAHYAYAGTFRKQELYLRPDLYTPPTP